MCTWIRRFVLFHAKRHPRGMGEREITAFLTYLAVQKNVAASTQNQALSALLFLYQKVLEMPVDWLDDVVRARRPKRLPVVLSRDEVARWFNALSGISQLIAQLMYGTGMRLMETLRLRVKDLDFERYQVIIRAGKGDKDRYTVLPRHLSASGTVDTLRTIVGAPHPGQELLSFHRYTWRSWRLGGSTNSFLAALASWRFN